MRRVLLVAALCVPMTALAQPAAKDPFTLGDAAAGAAASATCGACHGPGGNSINPEWPKLAGQGSRYLFEQLQAFKSGSRQNPLMSAQANLPESDLRNLAAHFAAQKPSPGVASKEAITLAQKAYRAGDGARGVPACAACHGPTGAGNEAAAYPRIGGQHAAYAAARLRAYRTAAATDLPDGNFKIMAAVAAQLSDAEIEALASYINGLQ